MKKFKEWLKQLWEDFTTWFTEKTYSNLDYSDLDMMLQLIHIVRDEYVQTYYKKGLKYCFKLAAIEHPELDYHYFWDYIPGVERDIMEAKYKCCCHKLFWDEDDLESRLKGLDLMEEYYLELKRIYKRFKLW